MLAVGEVAAHRGPTRSVFGRPNTFFCRLHVPRKTERERRRPCRPRVRPTASSTPLCLLTSPQADAVRLQPPLHRYLRRHPDPLLRYRPRALSLCRHRAWHRPIQRRRLCLVRPERRRRGGLSKNFKRGHCPRRPKTKSRVGRTQGVVCHPTKLYSIDYSQLSNSRNPKQKAMMR